MSDFNTIRTTASPSHADPRTGASDQSGVAAGEGRQLECFMTTARLPDKLQFSGHETFPLRQLWLRKAYFAVAESDSTNVFGEEAAIRRFGVGKNMVSAIRHWALAAGVLEESGSNTIQTAPLGDMLFGKNAVDPYLERPATAWLVHWMLAGIAARSTTWYWVFNRMTSQSFDRNAIVKALSEVVSEKRSRVSEITLKRDVEVCLRCYLTRRDGKEVDDAAEPLLSELSLITEGPTGTFQFRRGPKPNLPDALFAVALGQFWDRWEENTGSSQNTLSFESIAHDFGSPGRVFKLDEASVAERLIGLEEVSDGAMIWTDSAGLRQVSRPNGRLDPRSSMKLLRRAYVR